MIQEIAVSETAPSVTNCHTLLDSLQKICLMHGIEVSYYKKLFQTVENIILFIEKDDIPQYLLFLEDVFEYVEKYHYQKGMKKIIQELQHFIKANTYGTASDHALLLDYQAALEIKTEKAIKLEKEALAQIKETTKENAHLVSNLHSNLGGLYRINGQLNMAKKAHGNGYLKPTDSEQRDIFELLHRRRKKSSTIFCSKYEFEEWYDQLGGDDSPLADAIIDRIAH